MTFSCCCFVTKNSFSSLFFHSNHRHLQLMTKTYISSWNTYHSVTKISSVTSKSSHIATSLVVNDSTHPRRNKAQGKSTNHGNKARKSTKSSPCTHASSPLNQCTSPWTNACKPLENRAAATTSAHTGQTGAQHVHRISTLTGRISNLDRSDWCTP
jgi:hypothetical protein